MQKKLIDGLLEEKTGYWKRRKRLMSFWKVGEVEEVIFDLLPENRYLAEIQHMGYEFSQKVNNFLSIKYIIEKPEAYEGKEIIDKFYIEHPDNKIRHMHINFLNKFSQEIAQLKVGEDLEESHVLYKKCWLTIKHKKSNNNDGNIYANITKRELYGKEEPTTDLIVLSERPTPLNKIVDDEVPFW